MHTESILNPPQSAILKSGRVVLLPKESIGEHITDKREELIIVMKGTATLIKEKERIELNANQTHYIKEGITHNIINESYEPLEYIYVVGLFRC